MLLKSENKTIDEIIKLTDWEVFRAYHKAFVSGDIDFCLTVFQRLTSDRKWVLENTHMLALLKLLALQMTLLNKASMAISFYNSVASTILGREYPQELYGKEYTEERVKEINVLKSKIDDLDSKSGLALDLEEYAFFDGMKAEFDYWKTLLTPSSEEKQKGIEPDKNN